MGCSLRRSQAGGSGSDAGVAAHGEQGAGQQGGSHPQVGREGLQLGNPLHAMQQHSVNAIYIRYNIKR